MRSTAAIAILALLLSISAPARAEQPDPAWAFVAGALPILAGFIAGGVLLGTSGDGAAQNDAGWLAIQGGFVLAPVTGHAVVGEWGRGALFALLPAASFGSSAALFDYAPAAVAHGTLQQQRVLWALFGVGFISSTVGVVDAVFAPDRARKIYVAPLASSASPAHGGSTAGLVIGGVL